MTTPSSKLQISQATDILLSPTKSTLPRYRAYIHARNRFFSAFPPQGQFVRIHTPSDNLLCGLYAIVISFQHQHPGTSPSPTLEDLLSVCRSCGFDNEGNLSGDQLSLVFSTWGAKVLLDDTDDGGRAKKRRCQLGYLSRYNGPGWEEEARKGEDVPVMMGTREVDTEEQGHDILRLWVWNDGGWAGGGMGHWEGIRRVDEGGEGE
ncbi:hypothetical protein QBC40DRAFT_220584 [Triangularia verruculosa]|uniref:Uncharacterized protein n=1 Tax=Triangularia verruculosa TaxID=2587418 RepID=A0AAN6XS98_9PEZI|nr:hypothetical protein QBC40DRAFT_220584 [Triangularia verruculosa]